MQYAKRVPESKKNHFKLAFFLMALLLLSSAACEGTGGAATPSVEGGLEVADGIILDTTNDWYVETTGDDDNSCASVEEACLSIVSTLRRTRPFDRVHVGAGTFMDFSDYGGVLRIVHNISIIGAGRGVTILDGESVRAGIQVGIFGSQTEVHFEGFTLQNTGRGPASGCIGITGDADVTVQDVELRNCWRSGVFHTGGGLVHLIDVFIHDAVDEETSADFTLNGTGIETTGEMIIEGGEIVDNPLNGMEISGGPVSVSGTLISGNLLRGVVVRGSGEASLTRVNITDNGDRGFGTGLYVDSGMLTVTDSEIYDNVGGGVYVREGVLRMNSSNIRDERGRALGVAEAGTAELDAVVITNVGRGGPGFNPVVGNYGDLTIRRSRIVGNFRTAIYNGGAGRATITDSDISNNDSDNRGGDSALYNESGAQLVIARTLVANNETGDRAAFESIGLLLAVNVSVSNNSGLGMRARAPFNISYSTIAENDGIGALFDGEGGLLGDILVANNRGADCNGATFNSIHDGTNIDTDGSCEFVASYSDTELLLGSLEDNGGLTRTHALDPLSPAVDVASSTTCPTSDQRSQARPPVPNCDVGAYEISDTTIVILPIVSEETPEAREFVIPIPDGQPRVVITTDTLCLTGPSASDYEIVNTLRQEQVGQLIGAGDTGQGNRDWLVMSHPNFPETDCWVDADFALPSIPFSEMRLIFVPLAPTATPKATREPGTPVPPTPTCDPQQGGC